MIDLKQILAIGQLGARTAGYYAKKPLRERPGLESFLASYREDRLTPMTAAQRELLPVLAACVACGLCEAYCPAMGGQGDPGEDRPLAASDRHRFPGPMALASSQSRGIPDYGAVTPALEASERRCEGCSAPCTSICPTGVPLPELLAFIRHHVEAQERDAPQPAP